MLDLASCDLVEVGSLIHDFPDFVGVFFCAAGHHLGGGVVCFSSSLNPTVFLSSLLPR
jgi:hypothetical protein